MTLADGSLLNRQIDEYQIDRALGTGGMAKVYRALDTKLKRYVALKVIAPGFRADPEYARRFEREAQSIARLDHPNIVHIYRFGEANGVYYMAMQYIEGADVQWLVADYKAHNELMPLSDVVRIITDIGAALDYAHSQNVIHRDIKPANLMVDQQGRAILTDFGLALLADLGTQGAIFGSPHYIAPEQAQSSANVVPQSDLYALGVTLFEMLTGDLPFPDGPATELAMRHMTEPPPPPSQVNLVIPPAVDAVVLHCLEKNPFDRYQTGHELSAALTQAFQVWQSGLAQESADIGARRPSLVLIPQKVNERVAHESELETSAAAPNLAIVPFVTPIPAQTATLRAPPAASTQPKAAGSAVRPVWQAPLVFGLGVFVVGLIGLALLLLAARNNGQNSAALLSTITATNAPTQTFTLTPTHSPSPTPTVTDLPTPTALVLNAVIPPSVAPPLPTPIPLVIPPTIVLPFAPSPVSAAIGTTSLFVTPMSGTLLFSAASGWFALTNTSNRPLPLTGLELSLNHQPVVLTNWGIPALIPGACLRINQNGKPGSTLPPGCQTPIDYQSSSNNNGNGPGKGDKHGNDAWFSPDAVIGVRLSNVVLLLGGDRHWLVFNNPTSAALPLTGIKFTLQNGTVFDLSIDTLGSKSCLRFHAGNDPPKAAPSECDALQQDLPGIPLDAGTLTVTLLAPATYG
ncbi:MAG: serine/threonine protein kinase [Aggregatilineales bacterium]